MRTILFLLTLVSTSHILAQSGFSVGVMGAPQLTGIRLTPEGYEMSKPLIYKPRFGYEGGCRFRYDFNTVFSLQTGVSWALLQAATNRVTFFMEDVNNTTIPVFIKSDINLKYLHVPLACSFYKGNKWRFGFTFGGAYNSLSRSEETTTLDYPTFSRVFENNIDFKEQNQFISAVAGIGVEYVHQRFAFRAEPSGNYQLYFFDNEEANKNYRFWSAGIALSTFYRF